MLCLWARAENDSHIIKVGGGGGGGGAGCCSMPPGRGRGRCRDSYGGGGGGIPLLFKIPPPPLKHLVPQPLSKNPV